MKSAVDSIFSPRRMAREHSILASLSFSDSLPPHEIIVAQDIWNGLFFSAQPGSLETTGDRILVSLAFHRVKPHFHQCIETRNIVWALPPRSPQHIPAPGFVIVSHGINHDISQDYNLAYCSLVTVVPVPLTHVELVASRVHALTAEQLSRVEHYFHGSVRLLGTRDVVHCNPTDSLKRVFLQPPVKLEIAVSEPVSQGLSIPGKTRFFLVFEHSESDTTESSVKNEYEAREDVPHDDEFTIDENFFASSTLPSAGFASAELLQDTRQENSTDTGAKSLRIDSLPRCSTVNLHDSYVAFASTEDMGKLGAFNGDWCTVTFPEGQSRLVQVVAIDIPSAQRLYASSQVLHDSSPKSRKTSVVSMHATPFGSASPPIPIARSVSLARVASPLLLDTMHYSAAVFSLKEKLETFRCLVKSGDVISVLVCADRPWKLNESDYDDSVSEDVVNSLWSSSAFTKSHICDVAHFVVSNVENEGSGFNDKQSELDTIFRAASSGELGHWIDPSSTRVMQTGIEHHPVPGEEYNSSATGFGIESFQNYYTKLHELASAALDQAAPTLGLELVILLKGTAGPVMDAVVEAVANRLGFHLLQTDVFDIVDETEAKTVARLKKEFDTAMSCSPCILFFRNVEGFVREAQTDLAKENPMARRFKECTSKLIQNWQRTGYPVVVIATSNNTERLSASMLSCFKHEIDFEVPDDLARLSLLRSLLHAELLALDVSLRDIAVQTAAFTDDDILNLVCQMRLTASERALESIPLQAQENIPDVRDAGLSLNADDVNSAIERARASFSQNIGAPSIPKVSWEDVGGLAEVKQDILDTIQLPLDNPSLFTDGLKQRSGILLYGPPGTGKTLVAKAVATTCSLNFLSIKGPELLNMYIGESEANVRRVFQQARDAKPCVVFFDELDSIAPKRGNHGDSGGVMDRIVSQLLAELDGMSSPKAGTDVFVIGATNRPDLLDPALLRPGRFDRLLYLGVSMTHEAQLSILKALTRKFHLDPQLDLIDIAEQCPFNYTGADLYALCSDALLKAMSRKAQSVEKILERMNKDRDIHNQHYPLTPLYYLSELASQSDTNVIVSRTDFEDALRELVPSVSQAEMDHYKQVQEHFSKGLGNPSEYVSAV